MFAPGSGRPLGVTGGLIVLIAILWAGSVVPRSVGLGACVLLAAGAWAFLAQFFRDPERPTGDGIVSAADGRVREIHEENGILRISVFMNVTDVHVNRAPLSGRIARIDDSGHGFRPAYQVDAGHNVQRRYQFETDLGMVEVVQMTGILARRLISFVRPGETVRKGGRFGMIILGSRVDVLLPSARVRSMVRPGERVHAGSTMIAQVIA